MITYATCSAKERHYTEVRRNEWQCEHGVGRGGECEACPQGVGEAKVPTRCPAHPSKGECQAPRQLDTNQDARCQECNRGVMVEAVCSFCGHAEPAQARQGLACAGELPLGEDECHCTLCHQTFPTDKAFFVHQKQVGGCKPGRASSSPQEGQEGPQGGSNVTDNAGDGLAPIPAQRHGYTGDRRSLSPKGTSGSADVLKPRKCRAGRHVKRVRGECPLCVAERAQEYRARRKSVL